MLNKYCVEQYLQSSRFLILRLRSFFSHLLCLLCWSQLVPMEWCAGVGSENKRCSHFFHDGLELWLSFFDACAKMSGCMCVMELVHLVWVCARVWWSWFTSYWTCAALSQVGQKITADSELELFVVLAILFCLYVWQVCKYICIKQCILQDAEKRL